MITPIEIQRKTFKSGIGYDRREVDSFLKEVSAGYEKLYKDNIELLDRFNALNDRIQYYKTVEETLQKTLVYAEKAAEDIRNAARVEAKNIQNEAKINANKILSDATYERDGIHLQSMALVRQFEQYKAQYKQILAVQTDLITSDLCNLQLSDYDISEFLVKPETKETPVSEKLDREESDIEAPLLQVKEEKPLNFSFAAYSLSDETDVDVMEEKPIEIIKAAETVEEEPIEITEEEVEDKPIEITEEEMEDKPIEIAEEEVEDEPIETIQIEEEVEDEPIETIQIEDHIEETEESDFVGIKKLNIHPEATLQLTQKKELTEMEEKEELAKMIKEITGNIGFTASTKESDDDKKEFNICEAEDEIDLEAFEFIDTEKDIM